MDQNRMNCQIMISQPNPVPTIDMSQVKGLRQGQKRHQVQVPTEIINSIIDQAFSLAPTDLRSLLNYGLVSRQWIPFTRQLYMAHKQFEFKGGYEYPEWKEENTEFIRLLRARPSTLRDSVSKVVVRGPDEGCGRDVNWLGNDEDYVYLNKLITFQLGLFTNVQHLTLKSFNWFKLRNDAILVLGEQKSLISLTLEKVTFRDLEHMFHILLYVFPNIEELRLVETNFGLKALNVALPSSEDPPHKFSFFPRLRRLEMDVYPRTLSLLDTRCLPTKCEYLGFREISSFGHLLKAKSIIQHAGSDLVHLKLDIQIDIAYLLVDFTRNDNLRQLDITYLVPYEASSTYTLNWLTEAIYTIVSPHFSKLNLELWYYPLEADAIGLFNLSRLQEALLRMMVSPSNVSSQVNLTFMQMRRLRGLDYDHFVIAVKKEMRTLYKQRRLSVLIEY